MRGLLIAVLSLFLAASPAADSTAAGSARAGQDGQAIFLLVPADKASDFRQAMPQAASQDISMASGSPITIEGKQYTLVGLPAHRLDDLHTAIGDKPFHDDTKVLLSFGQFVNVADLSAIERQAGVQAGSSAGMTPSREQTSAPGAQAAGAQTSAGSQTWRGFPKDHVILVVPQGQLNRLNLSQSAARDVFVVMPMEEYNRVAGTTGTGSATTSSMQGGQQTTSMSQGQERTGGPGTGQSMTSVQGEVKQLQRDSDTVQRITPAAGGRMILLEDGRNLFLPDSVQVTGSHLQPGSHLQGTYIETQDGRNIITQLSTPGMRN
jgi:hypothetical protein